MNLMILRRTHVCIWLAVLMLLLSCTTALAVDTPDKLVGTWVASTGDGTAPAALILSADGAASLSINGTVTIHTWFLKGKTLNLLQGTTLTPLTYNGFTLKYALNDPQLTFKKASSDALVDPATSTEPLIPEYVIHSYDDKLACGPFMPLTLQSGWPIMHAIGPGMTLEISYISSDHTLWLVFPDAQGGEKTVGQDGVTYRNGRACFTWEQLAGVLGEDKDAWGMRMQCTASESWQITGLQLVDSAAAAAAEPKEPLLGRWSQMTATGEFVLFLNEHRLCTISTGDSVYRFTWTRTQNELTLVQSGIPITVTYDPAANTLAMNLNGRSLTLTRAVQ
ncbi:MAG: hypothetical protein IJZ74_05970 [Clostridia bacterium]|nr:hypothetical protein [Clostridia bacterium]